LAIIKFSSYCFDAYQVFLKDDRTRLIRKEFFRKTPGKEAHAWKLIVDL